MNCSQLMRVENAIGAIFKLGVENNLLDFGYAYPY